MSEWKETTLGEVANIDSGFPFKSKEYTDDGNMRVVRGKNVTVGTIRWGTDAKFWDYPTDGLERYFLTENDIVIGMDGSKIGENRSKIKESDLPAILAQRVGRVRAKGQNSQEFLWHAINSDGFVQYIKSIHTGTSIPHISQKQIGNFEIQIPPPSEQHSIAEILSSLDDKIDLLHRQNQTLEQMAETLFRQWFVEEADEGWEEGVLKDLFVLQRGYDLPKQNRVDGPFPIYAASGESGGHKEFKVKGPGVTTGRSGILGNVFYVTDDFWPLNTSLYVKEFKRATPLFAYFFLKTIDIQSFNAGSAVPTLNRNHIHEYPVLIPTFEMLNHFDETVKPIFQKIKSNQTQIRALTALRDTLLPKLMSGEVRVEI